MQPKNNPPTIDRNCHQRTAVFCHFCLLIHTSQYFNANPNIIKVVESPKPHNIWSWLWLNRDHRCRWWLCRLQYLRGLIWLTAAAASNASLPLTSKIFLLLCSGLTEMVKENTYILGTRILILQGKKCLWPLSNYTQDQLENSTTSAREEKIRWWMRHHPWEEEYDRLW